MQLKFFVLCILVFSFPSFAERTRRPQQQTRRIAKVLERRQMSPFQFGLDLGFDGLWGKVSNSDIVAKGLGYSASLVGQYYFANRFRITVAPGYQFMRLGKPLDGSGALTDPSPANFDQSVRYLGVTTLFAYEIEGREPRAYYQLDHISPMWWIEGGSQALFPLSAEQTAVGSTRSFTAKKNLAAILGVSGDFNLFAENLLTARLHLVYSFAGGSEGNFYGIRFLAGFYL